MRVLPASPQSILIVAEHAPGNGFRFGVEKGAPGDDLRRFAPVGLGSVYPARRLQHRGGQGARAVWVLADPLRAGGEDLFGVIGPNLLAGDDGIADVVADGALIPRLADAEAAHIADLHVHHHLRRRHHQQTQLAKRIDADAGEPVIEPHCVGAGRKGVGEAIAARLAGGDALLQRCTVGDALRL